MASYEIMYQKSAVQHKIQQTKNVQFSFRELVREQFMEILKET